MPSAETLQKRIKADNRKLRRKKRKRARLTKERKEISARRRKVQATIERVRKRRKRRRRKLRQKQGGGKHRAVSWAWQQHGLKEQPAGSNRGGLITTMQQHFGSWLVGQPWCGTFLGYALKLYGGVKGITSRVASVALIEEDAKAGRNGFRSWHGPGEGKRGDVVVLFGHGVHVELIVKRESWGYVTVGGNTSFEGSTGSQSNGGAVARRKRTFGVVRGCARPAY